MVVKRISVVLVILLLLALSVSLVQAKGPGGGGGGGSGGGGAPPVTPGGGPPAGTMMDVKGCAYFDGTLGVWRLRAPDADLGYPNCLPEADTDWKIDFGPEGYCPDPCLIGDLILDEFSALDQVKTIRIGKNLVGTFKCIEYDGACTDILAQTDPKGPARKAGWEWIPLVPAEGTNYGRPLEGKWVRVFGRAGETDYAVLAWEIRYPNTTSLPNDYQRWFWWRSLGQPWAKFYLLNCTAPGEE